MKFSADTLMAYADGELEPSERAAIEQALRTDPQAAAIVERHRQERALLKSAFAADLAAPVPDRLVATALKAPAGAPPAVADLNEARAARQETSRRRWSWPEWSALAASALLGVLIGRIALQPQAGAAWLAQDGRIAPDSALAVALSSQPGGALETNSPAVIGLSYRSTTGEYCRTFAMQDAEALAGVACRRSEGWRVEVLAPSEASGTGHYRLADSTLPSTVLHVVERQIEGEPLDADAEAQAQAQGWRP